MSYTLFSAARGLNRRAPLPTSHGGVMGCLCEIYRDAPAPSTDLGVGRDIWWAIFSGEKSARLNDTALVKYHTVGRLNFLQNSLCGGTLIPSRCVGGHLCCLINCCSSPPRCGASSKAAVVKVNFNVARLSWQGSTASPSTSPSF